MRYAYKRTIAALSVMALLGGCGGGGSDSTASGPTTPTPTTPTPTTPETPTTPTTPTPTPSVTPRLAASTTIVDGTTVGTSNANWSNGDTDTGGRGAVTATLPCGLPGTNYAYSHLNIYLDGQQQSIPQDIGWVDPDAALPAGSVSFSCVYPVHTDDMSGKIRIDTTNNATFTLGQFFQIWGQPLTSSNVAGLTGKPVAVWVNDNGTLSQYTGDPAQLQLTPGRDISIVVGTPPAEIANYAWNDPPPLSTNPVVLNGATVGTPHYNNGDTANGGQGQTIDGLACAPMNETYHVHAHVSIFNNRAQYAFPQNVGIVANSVTNPGNGCDYPLHVHDNTGVIHAEAEAYRRLTLGQLFKIWGQPLSRTQVADSPAGAPISFFINDGGDVREYMGDPANIEMLSRRAVTIQIGTPLTQIQTYDWSVYGQPR
ncbi:MAG: hypothetical protein ACTHL1_00970 [Burkholderiaceae bacterium]